MPVEFRAGKFAPLAPLQGGGPFVPTIGNRVIANDPSALYRRISGESVSKIIKASPIYWTGVLVMFAALIGAIIMSVDQNNYQVIGYSFLYAITGVLAIALFFTSGTTEAFEYLGDKGDAIILQAAEFAKLPKKAVDSVANAVTDASDFLARTLSATARVDNISSVP